VGGNSSHGILGSQGVQCSSDAASEEGGGVALGVGGGGGGKFRPKGEKLLASAHADRRFFLNSFLLTKQ